MFEVGDHIDYYAVDHSPSYLWNSATWEISEALLPFLAIDAGPRKPGTGKTDRRAIEIRDGVILNKDVLEFQHRSPAFRAPAGRGNRQGQPARSRSSYGRGRCRHALPVRLDSGSAIV